MLLEARYEICEAKFGQCGSSKARDLERCDSRRSQAYVEERRRNPLIRPGADTTLGRAIRLEQAVQIADIQNYKA